MCTLAIFRGLSARFPLVVAANRDEFFERPTAAPQIFEDRPGVVAGRDLRAGGTWLGCRVSGGPLIVGLLNRSQGAAPGPAPAGERSRGLLALDALAGSSVEEVVATVRTQALGAYGGFNLLAADLQRAVVIDNSKGIRLTELPAGLSVLTNLDVNDPRCPRLASAAKDFEAAAPALAAARDPAEIVARLGTVLGNHENSVDATSDNPLARLCVHTPDYGTRSASIIVVEAPAVVSYFHAAGAPCRTVFDSIGRWELTPG